MAVLRQRNYPPAVCVLWIMNFKSSSRTADARSPRIIRCTRAKETDALHPRMVGSECFGREAAPRDRNASERLYRFRHADAGSVGSIR